MFITLFCDGFSSGNCFSTSNEPLATTMRKIHPYRTSLPICIWQSVKFAFLFIRVKCFIAFLKIFTEASHRLHWCLVKTVPTFENLTYQKPISFASRKDCCIRKDYVVQSCMLEYFVWDSSTIRLEIYSLPWRLRYIFQNAIFQIFSLNSSGTL